MIYFGSWVAAPPPHTHHQKRVKTPNNTVVGFKDLKMLRHRLSFPGLAEREKERERIQHVNKSIPWPEIEFVPLAKEASLGSSENVYEEKEVMTQRQEDYTKCQKCKIEEIEHSVMLREGKIAPGQRRGKSGQGDWRAPGCTCSIVEGHGSCSLTMLLLMHTSLGLGLLILLHVCRDGKHWAEEVRAGPENAVCFLFYTFF